MRKIDFNANTEVKYLANWKIVQTNMARHKIDKVVPIDRLVKCKMQDNLEFLQWCKKFWDQYFPGGEYDANGRRGGTVPSLSSSVSNHPAPIRTTMSSSSSSAQPQAVAPVAAAAPRRAAGTASRTAVPAAPASTRVGVASSAATAALQRENEALNETIAGLETERDFYFNKLRDIEILIQNATDTESSPEEKEKLERDLVKQIQEVLYSTEEGFEVPNADGGLEGEMQQLDVQDGQYDEDQVF